MSFPDFSSPMLTFTQRHKTRLQDQSARSRLLFASLVCPACLPESPKLQVRPASLCLFPKVFAFAALSFAQVFVNTMVGVDPWGSSLQKSSVAAATGLVESKLSKTLKRAKKSKSTSEHL